MAMLEELIALGRVAVVTMELRRGVMGDLASIPALADAVRTGGVVPAPTPVATARASGGSSPSPA